MIQTILEKYPSYFYVDPLSTFVGGFAIFFFFLALIYSFPYMGHKGTVRYYLYLFLTMVSSLGVIFSNHLVVFLMFWGFLGFLLYLLINFGENKETPATAKKALIIIGGTDAIMILGLAAIFYLTGSLLMTEIHLDLNSRAAVFAFLCLLCGALAKAGAMPFHTWVPDTASDAPIPVTAYLPASLDKLLGIYFLARLSLNLFGMTPSMNTLLMVIGSVTIMVAVMMALVQHDLKKLLGYHAVSQVGYMILGIGTGNPLGIAGGLFHMLNNAIYKSCLFFCGGSIEKKCGTTDMEHLGGLSKTMPFTFIAFLIASLAIAGVPPLNGFASKWLIYQGIIETGKSGGALWIVWLIAAMFGSALTLASFMKMIHAIFLGQSSKDRSVEPKENSFLMLAPPVVLSVICIVFGIFSYRIPLKKFIFPSIGAEISFAGIWSPSMATALIFAGLAVGLLIYIFGNLAKMRETDVFVGGESLKEHPEMRVSGTEFYHTIQNMEPLQKIYGHAERKNFDPYDVGVKMSMGVNRILARLHNGILSTYLSWCLLGISLLLLFFI
ncbi:MAG: hypothetical protein LHV69_10215 [Elusimicrobia bacterium]|nr:hypothetical protein [Candidatus Obscuribacterium magneticum]